MSLVIDIARHMGFNFHDYAKCGRKRCYRCQRMAAALDNPTLWRGEILGTLERKRIRDRERARVA